MRTKYLIVAISSLLAFSCLSARGQTELNEDSSAPPVDEPAGFEIANGGFKERDTQTVAISGEEFIVEYDLWEDRMPKLNGTSDKELHGVVRLIPSDPTRTHGTLSLQRVIVKTHAGLSLHPDSALQVGENRSQYTIEVRDISVSPNDGIQSLTIEISSETTDPVRVEIVDPTIGVVY